ncbi:MAG: hypothetical protein LLF94_05515 [Chlamydiales bacterium]|nr:hypothetical protein [Chlamydiales bacterium]
MNTDFLQYKCKLITPLSALSPAQSSILPSLVEEADSAPTPIIVKTTPPPSIDKTGGHYFMGGIPALMQAVVLLQKDPTAHVTYVNDGRIRKSTQSAHQGHVHPTEWASAELGNRQLMRVMLGTLGLMKLAPPTDVVNYSFVHFPLSKLSLSIMINNIGFKLLHSLMAKNGVSEDDRWQCTAVRESLKVHKALSQEIEASGHEPTFYSHWRLIWSSDKAGIQKKQALWGELGIQTEVLTPEELKAYTLLRTDTPLFGLKVLGDGKFYANVDGKIVAHLSRKYASTFQSRQATVTELYLNYDNKPCAVREVLQDGTSQIVAVDSFYGSPGHNQVYAEHSKTPMWPEVPVTGVSTLWLAKLDKKMLLERFGNMDHQALVTYIKKLPGSANLTNMHTTIWNACVEGDCVHIVVRATQGANYNSLEADPNDLYNMQENIKRFYIGEWQLITAGSCSRKTTTSNVPQYTSGFIHGLSGIGYSFSAAPQELLNRPSLLETFRKKFSI